MKITLKEILMLLVVLCSGHAMAKSATVTMAPVKTEDQKVKYQTVKVDGLNIFYREAGNPKKPVILLLHGFPSSSHMYRQLITDLSADYHLIAPDYPGFGFSSCPSIINFDYTFDHLSNIMEHFIVKLGLTHFSLYMQDYGGPIGFRIATKHPDWISALLIQNANIYNDGLGEGFKKIMDMEDAGDKAEVEKILRTIISFDGIKSQYTGGSKYQEDVSPDAYTIDFSFMQPESEESIQNQLFQNYHLNLANYGKWQAYLRAHQPPTLVVWGKNDPIFTAPGGLAYKRDLKHPEIHLLDGGHFALEEYHLEIAFYIRRFLIKTNIK